MRPLPIETILNDSLFDTWCKQDVSRCSDSIQLYKSIIEFESKLESTTTQSSISILKLARHIHRKYVSMNTGTCTILNDTIRTLMSSRIHELLDGKQPYIELFEPLKPTILKHLNVMYDEYSNDCVTTEANPNWQSSSTSNSSDKKSTSVWYNEDIVDDKSSRHDTTVTHESEDSRIAFFSAVCHRLNSLQETTRSSSADDNVNNLSIDNDNRVTPYGSDGFAPPPHALRMHNLPKRFESLYRKKRHPIPVVATTSDSSGFGSGSGVSDFWSFERYGRSNNGTIDRRQMNNGFSTLQPTRKRNGDISKITVELRYENDIPMVAKISNESINLRYFKSIFGIHDNDNARYFFKSTCEDGTALYQWTLMFNDDDILPIFQNRITAICRICPSS